MPVVYSLARGLDYFFGNFLGVSSRRFMQFVGIRAGMIISLSKVRLPPLERKNYIPVAERSSTRVLSWSLKTTIVFTYQGWPLILFCWSWLTLLLLHGDNDFARHWLFYQDKIQLFSKRNPAGDVTHRDMYRRCIICAIGISVVVTLKRYWMANHIARRLYGKLQISCVTNRVVSVASHTVFHPTRSFQRSSLQRKCSSSDGKASATN